MISPRQVFPLCNAFRQRKESNETLIQIDYNQVAEFAIVMICEFYTALQLDLRYHKQVILLKSNQA